MDTRTLLPLIDFLAATPALPKHWDGWEIAPIGGGANNRLVRITSAAGDFAVKFAIRDARDRAGREYHALRLMRSVGCDLAPAPVLLERRRWNQPVVISTWLHGEVSSTPPTSEAEWHALIGHFAAIHQIKPAHTPIRLRKAWLSANSRAACRLMIDREAARVPEMHQPAALRDLKVRFDALHLPAWKRVPVALCRVDPNILNIVRGADQWRSVDWENSGWGDPAFEIADLMSHPAYMEVEPECWEWVNAEYARHMQDADCIPRIRAYYLTLLVWWCFRFNRYLYDFERGLDQRLAPRQEGWQDFIPARMAHYVRLASEAM